MMMICKLLIALAFCAGIAALTLWAQKSYWLGGYNFILLGMFLVVHVIVSSLVLWLIPSHALFKIVVVAFLIVGQWWAVEWIAMLVIWSLRGFAP
jgi:hypothetical protein